MSTYVIFVTRKCKNYSVQAMLILLFTHSICFGEIDRITISPTTREVIDSPNMSEAISKTMWSEQRTLSVIEDTMDIILKKASVSSDTFERCLQAVIHPSFPINENAIPILEWVVENSDRRLAQNAAGKCLEYMQHDSALADTVVLKYLIKYRDSNDAAVIADKLFIDEIQFTSEFVDGLWGVIAAPKSSQDVVSILTKTYFAETPIEQFIQSVHSALEEDKYIVAVLRGLSMYFMDKNYSFDWEADSLTRLREVVYSIAETAESEELIIQALRTSFVLLGPEQHPVSQKQLGINLQLIVVIEKIIETVEDPNFKEILIEHFRELFKSNGSVRTYEEWQERLSELR